MPYRSCLFSSAAILLLLAPTLSTVFATATENNGLRILPAPGHMVIDGKTDDWDLSGGIFACDDVEHQRDQYAVWLNAMYDKDNLYILARFTDLTPLNNPGQTIADDGFNGDCLQFRMIAAADTPNERTSHWTCWRGKDGADVMTLQNGKTIDGSQTIKDVKRQGAQQAFTINADGKGYVQELAIPWKFVTKDGTPPAPGASIRLTFEPNFSVGLKGRLTVKDLFQTNTRPDRVFTFMAWPFWGSATFETQAGPVKPQPVRLADGRQFPVSMQGGQPIVDWTGLVRAAELPGFKSIQFTMPDDGFISLNIKASDGTVARQLLNAAFYTKGPHEVKWDGLTNLNAHFPGDPVTAGSYHWSALYHKEIGLKLRGWAGNSGSVPWDNGNTTNWGGDEGSPVATTADDSQVYLAWDGAEAGSALLACDLNGNVKWKNKHGGMAGILSLATSDGVVYALSGGEDNGRLLYKLNAAQGDYVPWGNTTDVDLAVKSLWGNISGMPDRAESIAAKDGNLYVGFATAGKILMIDGKTGRVLDTINATTPTALQIGSDNSIYYISSGTSVLRIDASKNAALVVSGLTNAKALALNKDGLIYVAVGDPDNQVKVFDATGKALRTLGRQGGRALLGKWNPDGLRFISSVAVTADGKLWIAEHYPFPRRFSSWDTKTSRFAKEYFGSSDYGATGGAIDPLNPNVMVGMGCEWRLDPVTGLAQCVAVISRGMGNSRFGVGSNGRLYLAVFPSSTFDGGAPIDIFERTGEGEYKLRARFDHPDKPAVGTRFWADANGDEQIQPNEVTSISSTLNLNYWYLPMAPDLTFYFNNRQFKVTRFTPAGAPMYNINNPTQLPGTDAGAGMGAGISMGSADDQLVLYNGAYDADRSTFNAYSIGGKMLWSYPNNFVGVHGSHNATPSEIGMIRGAYDIAGTAKLPDPIGNIWVIPTNVGEWHILTGDGFYLTRLFQGDPFKIQWPKEAVPGADMTNTPPGLGGEDFGGSIAGGKDGKLYIQAGKTGFWNLEVTGLDTVRAIAGEKIGMNDADVAQAKTMRESELQIAVGTHTLAIKKATPTFTGDIVADFKGSEVAAFQKSDAAAIKVAAAWDDQNLYLGWNVNDTTPWQNSAKVPEDMYVGGDTVDFQLGADPNAKKDRTEAKAGDLRLSIGNFQNNATAVLYRKVCDNKKPKTFSSGVVHSYPMDFVDVLADAKITVKTRADGYVVEAVIPLSDLGVKLSAGLVLSGDFGATHGGPGGTRTRLRTYWNNQHTGLVDDAVFELQMEPKNWGELQFAP
jgi:hypothetical protein